MIPDQRVALHRLGIGVPGIARGKRARGVAIEGPTALVPRLDRHDAPPIVVGARARAAIGVPRSGLTLADAAAHFGLEAHRRLASRVGVEPRGERAVHMPVVVVGDLRDANAIRAPEQDRARADAFVERAGDAQLSTRVAQPIGTLRPSVTTARIEHE
jgi:hypothetical protein